MKYRVVVWSLISFVVIILPVTGRVLVPVTSEHHWEDKESPEWEQQMEALNLCVPTRCQITPWKVGLKETVGTRKISVNS